MVNGVAAMKLNTHADESSNEMHLQTRTFDLSDVNDHRDFRG